MKKFIFTAVSLLIILPCMAMPIGIVYDSCHTTSHDLVDNCAKKINSLLSNKLNRIIIIKSEEFNSPLLLKTLISLKQQGAAILLLTKKPRNSLTNLTLLKHGILAEALPDTESDSTTITIVRADQQGQHIEGLYASGSYELTTKKRYFNTDMVFLLSSALTLNAMNEILDRKIRQKKTLWEIFGAHYINRHFPDNLVRTTHRVKSFLRGLLDQNVSLVYSYSCITPNCHHIDSIKPESRSKAIQSQMAVFYSPDIIIKHSAPFHYQRPITTK